MHVNMNFILNVDILNFFHSISTEAVYESLLEIGIDKHIALIYSTICTLNNKLPQGCPTSPILSNIVCKKLDKLLSEFSFKHNLNYSRYADDITFSGDKNIFNNVFISELKLILKEFNFNLNYEKTRILDKTKRQDVTGIVVNEKINVSRKYIRELRAMIHNFSKNPSKQIHLIHIIRGKLSYLKMVRGNDHIYNNLNDKFLESLGFKKKSQNSLSNPFITVEKKINIKFQNISNELAQKVFKKKYLFFDTETTGLPKIFNAPISKSENWPRLVQLAYIIYDASGNKLKSNNYIIKPVGYDIPIESSSVHGISNNYALANGFLIKNVLEEFINDLNDISLIVAHNMSFDKKIIESELYRNGFNFNFKEEKLFCTMVSSVDFCKIKNHFGYFKWPKLEELHFKLFNDNFENAHDAFTDVTITAKCFWELKKLGIIKTI
jgi:DNA polymerase-3 subunit epsilon